MPFFRHIYIIYSINVYKICIELLIVKVIERIIYGIFKYLRDLIINIKVKSHN